MPERILPAGVLVTGAWAFLALVFLVVRALAYGRPEFFSRPAGSMTAGVRYAFGPAMRPSAKESVRRHRGVWFAGVGYHLGIVSSIAIVALTAARVQPGGAAAGVEAPGIAPARAALALLGILSLAGAVCGAILLARRASSPVLRALSCPDDYISNLLVTSLSALAFAATLVPALGPVLLAEACVLFLYAPIGKIRHCVFFFTTRFFLGAHYGRRGAFPLP